MLRQLTIALALSYPTTGLAAVLCVNPAGGACHTKIQDAVNVARPGDVIEIAEGVYFENVRITRGRGAIHLVGAGNRRTIIDPDVPNSGPAVLVEGHGAEVANLGVRNGRPHGIVVAAATNGVQIRGVRLVGVRDNGQRLLPSIAILVLPGCRDTRLLFNEIHAAGSIGIAVSESPNTLVQGNRLEQVEIGIDARGEAVQVVANRVASTARTGIITAGTGASFIDNIVESGRGGDSFVVSAVGATIRGNTLNNAGPALFFCSGNGIMTGNRSTGAFGAGAAFSIVGTGSDCRVVDNHVTGAATVGFQLDHFGVLFTDNTVTDSGVWPNGHCFVVIQGSDARPHVLMRNVATGCTDNGFRIATGGVTLQDNASHGSGLNGFAVARGPQPEGVSVVLQNNRSTDSGAAGFAVLDGAGSTTLTGNVGDRNRYDFCDDGTGTDVSGGNAFGTTSTTCDLGG